MKIKDLIYCNSGQEELKERFPDAKFEDASDEIHRERFSITTERKIEEYRLYLLFFLILAGIELVIKK